MPRHAADLSQLTEFLQVFGRIALQAGTFAPDDPEWQRAIEHLTATCSRVMDAGGSDALHIYVPAPGVVEDLLVAGASAEPIEAHRVMQSTMGRHVLSRLVDLFQASGAVAFVAYRHALRSDWAHLAVAVSAFREEQTLGGEPRRLDTALRESGCSGLQFLHQEDVPPSPDPSEPAAFWTARLATGQCSLALENTPGSGMSDVDDDIVRHDRLFAALVRPLGTDVVAAALRVSAAVSHPTDNRPLADWMALRLSAAEVDVAGWALAGMVSKDAWTAARDGHLSGPLRALRSLAPRLVEEEPRQRDLLVLLVRRGVVAIENVSQELRDRIRIAAWTDQFQADPKGFLARLAELADRKVLAQYALALRYVYAELLARGHFVHALALLRRLDDISTSPSEPYEGRNGQVAHAATQIRLLPTRQAVARLLEARSPEARAPILALLRQVGSTAVFPLLSVIDQIDDDNVRREVFATLRSMGGEIIPMLESELRNPGHPPYFRRDALKLLGELGDPRAVVTVRQSLRHRSPKVRRAAADALLRLMADGAWPELRPLLRDPEPEVLRHVVRRLSNGGCRDPEYLATLRDHLDAYISQEGINESLAYAVVHAVASLGPSRHGEPDFVESLQALSAEPSGGFAIFKRGSRVPEGLRQSARAALAAVTVGAA